MLIKAGVAINTISARAGQWPIYTRHYTGYICSPVAGMERYAVELFEKMLSIKGEAS
jgi:hypothetical protein